MIIKVLIALFLWGIIKFMGIVFIKVLLKRNPKLKEWMVNQVK